MTRYTSKAWFAGACMLALAACSGAATPVAPNDSRPGAAVAPNALRHGWISPTAKKQKLVFVSDYTASIILIYAEGATGSGPIGEIVTGISTPQGIATDTSGTLYVANQGNNTITEYPRGSMTPSATLSTDINKPLDVSVDSKGNLYVIEGSASTILEFKPGSTAPDTTVSLSHPSEATNARNGDLYVTYNQSSAGHVARCRRFKATCKDLGIDVQLAQGIALDLQGNLLVGDYYGSIIDIYKPGATTPFRTIPLSEEEPAKLALDSTDKTLYMADPANFAIRLFDYATGTQESSFTFGVDELEGVALSPGQKPGK